MITEWRNRPLESVYPIDICTSRYVTIAVLSEVLNRKPETLRGQYLSRLVKSKALVMAFPKTPNDPRQAYRKNTH